MRYIFAHDGTAINVDHIITIYVASTRQPEGHVVRCRTTLSHSQYAGDHAVLNLSPILPTLDAAETWRDLILQKLNPL